MTIRAEIEKLLATGLRNCEISRILNCTACYVSEIRAETGIRKTSAADRRIGTIKSMVADGKSDADIAAVLYVSAHTVRHDRQKYGIRQRQIHPKHHEIIRLSHAGFKQAYIMLELDVAKKTIRKALERQMRMDKNAGTKTASAGACNPINSQQTL